MYNVKSMVADEFISDEEMHKMNETYRGIDRTTDVISFALNDNKEII